MGCNRRNEEDVLGDFTRGRRNSCRRCFRDCEKALEFVEDVKDLLEEFFEDDKHDHHCCNKCCCNKCCCHNDNYWGR